MTNDEPQLKRRSYDGHIDSALRGLQRTLVGIGVILVILMLALGTVIMIQIHHNGEATHHVQAVQRCIVLHPRHPQVCSPLTVDK